MGGAVAGFAGDAEFGDASVYGAGGGVEMGFEAGGVAAAADDVPCFGTMIEFGRADEGGVARDPTFFGDEPGERETDLEIAVTFGDPEDLHVMGTGDEADARFDASSG